MYIYIFIFYIFEYSFSINLTNNQMALDQKHTTKNRSDRTEPIYTLSVASRLSGISVYTIQQYIRQGLILPYKTVTNRNLFSEIDIERLLNIRRLIDDQGLNIAGIKALYSLIPCWILKPCTDKVRKSCEAYESSVFPCWEAAEKGPECKHIDCRTCKVYRVLVEHKDIKSLLKEFF